MVPLIFRVFDLLKGPWVLQFFWHILTKVSRLNDQELEASSKVLGTNSVHFPRVRVAEGRVLRLFFKLNGDRAFTLFHTINLPAKGHHARGNLDLLVHEMVHVYQFEQVGSVYIWQALRAQKTEGYSYGGWSKLAENRAAGGQFSDYNREQQGQIAQDYYRQVVAPILSADDPVSLAFQPFINDLQSGVI